MTTEGFVLFASPSFVEGWARIFDTEGTLNQYNISRNGREADQKALLSDWIAVGNDIRNVMDHEQKSRQKES